MGGLDSCQGTIQYKSDNLYSQKGDNIRAVLIVLSKYSWVSPPTSIISISSRVVCSKSWLELRICDISETVESRDTVHGVEAS